MNANTVGAATHEATTTAAVEEIHDLEPATSLDSDAVITTESSGSNVARVIVRAGATSAEAGTRAIEELEKLIADLRTARGYLQSEGERLHRELSRYESLSHTAFTSVKVIVQSLGDWRKSGRQLHNRPAV